MNNAEHLGSSYVKSAGQKCSVSFLRVVKGSDFLNLIPSQLGGIVLFALPPCPTNSSFCNRIGHIIRLRSKPKMVWTYTPRIIAIRTVVADFKSNGDRTDMQNPTCPRRSDHYASPVFSTRLDLAAPAIRDRRRPQPTTGGFSNFGPKPIEKGGIKSLLSEVLRRYGNHVVSIARRALQGSAGTFFIHILGSGGNTGSWLVGSLPAAVG